MTSLASDHQTMAAAKSSHMLAETIDKSALCVSPSERASFELACRSGDIHAYEAAVEQFFSTWTTSLMGDDVHLMEALSEQPDISNRIRTICIEDDTRLYDPWNVPEPPPPESTHLWPRNDQGIVDSTLPGIMRLKNMLLQQTLKPTAIKIQDYCISEPNSLLFSNTLSHHHVGSIQPATTLARKIVEGTDVAITSITLERIDVNLSRDSYLFLPNIAEAGGPTSLCNPNVREMVLELSPQGQGQTIGLSQLHTVRLSSGVDPWWLEQILEHAIMLKDLELHGPNPLDATMPESVGSTQLQQLILVHLSVRGQTIFGVVKQSKQHLANIQLKSITLTDGLTWSTLLSTLGRDFPKLKSFQIVVPREKGAHDTASRAINFFGFEKDALPAEDSERIEIQERGPPENRRRNRVKYDGPNAGKVLQRLALYAA